MQWTPEVSNERNRTAIVRVGDGSRCGSHFEIIRSPIPKRVRHRRGLTEHSAGHHQCSDDDDAVQMLHLGALRTMGQSYRIFAQGPLWESGLSGIGKKSVSHYICLMRAASLIGRAFAA